MRYRHPVTGKLLDSPEEDFESTWKALGFVPNDVESVLDAEEPARANVESLDLEKLTREELDTRAAAVGIPDPASLPNKAAVINAIEGGESPEAT